ncbi:type IA DNA topoisomerase [Mobilitalea sibirica]|uniref:DNA topoisomerase n=1 Tax=Mobilitalea sibirica TaxID=1462919 RepID=A0A8J7HDB8_9FIRM|nr:DNA topoisomerase [Mobilitalea sibirica]MBH1940564.1 type IA DNA topoisomerase [Mobilitalea sibirica]
MSKSLYIAEKPSVATEFAKALKISGRKQDGFIESETAVVTWCVGHLVTMSYPEAYNPALKKWTMDTLPFLPKEFLYEVIPNVKKQFKIVRELLNRKDIDTIYVCTDSGREGEYIYRLVDKAARVPDTKVKKRVWIDSQTEEEILRGIREAKPLSSYDNLSDAAYLRAKEDYLMGINFSRILTLKYGNEVQRFLKSQKWSAISVGRVMTCVLGMVVRREREVRSFVKTPFYRVMAALMAGDKEFNGEFRAVEGSKYFNSPLLYKENGFLKRESATNLIAELAEDIPSITEDGNWSPNVNGEKQKELMAEVTRIEKKKENKNPPLLYNLAELQNDCARMFKISPDETLKVVQELYEKKLVTYPRTDARVLSSAVAKEIYKNIKGLQGLNTARDFATEILEQGTYKNIAKTRYVNDSQITDHYAIIPTGQGLNALGSITHTAARIYETIVRRFLSIFYPAAEYRKVGVTVAIKGESFFASFRVLEKEGYLKVLGSPNEKGTKDLGKDKDSPEEGDNGEDENSDQSFLQIVMSLKKGMLLPVHGLMIKEGETTPPKRYSSGTLILAMENAGQLIEDEELRAQIKGSGIGTSATRAEILNKLVKITYLHLNKKTQIITPTLLGELVFEVVNTSIKSLLNAELTASWEKGLTYVSEGQISKEEYMEKLEGFVGRMVEGVKTLNNQTALINYFNDVASYYK